MAKNNLVPAGALWKGKSAKVGDFFYGHIEVLNQEISIVVLPFDYKKEDDDMDFRILVHKKKEKKDKKK